MSLKIKSPETHTLVKRLAKLTGESQTTAVSIAVRERLERLQDRDGGGLSDRLLAIGRRAAPRFKEPFHSTQIGDLLYDDDGLPK